MPVEIPASWRVAALIAVFAAIGTAGAAAAADVAAGKAIFDRTCANCHSVDVGVNKVGPSLWHVVGRASATIEGYPYSPAMQGLHTVWTADTLNLYLENPRSDVHGVRMAFKGLPAAKDRADVIGYLESRQ